MAQTIVSSVYDEVRKTLPYDEDSLSEHFFNVPADRMESQVPRFLNAFEKIIIKDGAREVVTSSLNLDMSRKSEDLLHDMGSRFSAEYDSMRSANNQEILKLFVNKIDYYKAQAFIDTLIRSDFFKYSHYFVSSCLKVEYKCDLFLDFESQSLNNEFLVFEFRFYDLNFLFVNDAGGYRLPIVPGVKINVNSDFSKLKYYVEYRDDAVDVYAGSLYNLYINDIFIISNSQKFNSIKALSDLVRMNIQNNIIELIDAFAADSYKYFGLTPSEINRVSNTIIAQILEENYGEDRQNPILDIRSICKRKQVINDLNFLADYIGLNALLFGMYLTLSTYAKIGVVSGFSSIAGPLAIGLCFGLYFGSFILNRALKKNISLPSGLFMSKALCLNSFVFATYAAISTYANVGVIAGLTAATGPIGIGVAVGIFILSTCDLLYRRYCKNNVRVPVVNAPVVNAAQVEDETVANAVEEVDAGVNPHQPVQQVFQELQRGGPQGAEQTSVLGSGLDDEVEAPEVADA